MARYIISFHASTRHFSSHVRLYGFNLKMAESVECDTSEKLETDKTLSITNDKTLDFESNSNLSLSQEGSVVSIFIFF